MEESLDTSASQSTVVNDEPELTLIDLYRQMRANWRWYVVSIAVCLLIAAVYLMAATPKYTRTTEILLKDDTSQSVGADLSMLGVNPVPSEVLNEMFIMTSPEIMEQVVSRLNLNEVYMSKKWLRKIDLYKTSPVDVAVVDSLTDRTKSYGFTIKVNADTTGVVLSDFKKAGKKIKSDKIDAAFGQEVATPVGTFSINETKFMHQPALEGGKMPTTIKYSYTPLKICARNYCTQLESSFDEDRGNIVMLTISAASAQKASDILTAVVEAYNQRWVADKNKIAMATSQFIDDRLVSIEDELGDVESNITQYKSSHRMLDMESMANLYLAQSQENQKALNQLTQEIAIGRYLKSELASGDITRLLPATAEIGGTNIQAMVTEYNRAVSERNIRLETMPEESPLMKQKAEAIKRTREAILASVDAALETLNKRYKAISLVDSNTQNKLATAPGQAKYLMSEERKQKVKESLYLFLLQRREENELSQAFTVYNTRMITEPFGPTAPTSPNKKLILLVALVIGILIPTLIIYLKEVTNTKVRSRRDIEDLPIPFLGEIPLSDVPQHHYFNIHGFKLGSKVEPSPARKILVRPHTGDITNEAFRMIRTNIDFMGSMNHRQEVDRGRTIMVVSLNAGSGKTFTALNTASIFAIKNKKTCLVDLDLRKGTVSQNVGSPRKGLVDYLVGKNTNLDELIVKNVEGIENLDILPEGLIPPNPTELLYSPNLEQLIDDLRERYDYVFFDCPPIEIVADARLLNPYVDMTIFVMRSGLFEKSDLKVLRSLYDSHRYNNLAMVLNATDTVHGVYGSYGYGYHNRARKRR
ncbi:MAG: polysaccharide biosynthesis tyrosine autokinase [Bacteroides sp.]|nr:polysaccharide biosynthesis tyrosine autokinase [Bacteroides sp.]MCM1379326.1 polysaccharide biosynthesis tyrosine autokinase [Bacteroides sp.]MCM1445015.1 polysaccharide biosynthesis tyrosine autokinase [Prevotella sp.]